MYRPTVVSIRAQGYGIQYSDHRLAAHSLVTIQQHTIHSACKYLWSCKTPRKLFINCRGLDRRIGLLIPLQLNCTITATHPISILTTTGRPSAWFVAGIVHVYGNICSWVVCSGWYLCFANLGRCVRVCRYPG